MFRGGESRRRRGRGSDLPRRGVAAAPRVGSGSFAERSRRGRGADVRTRNPLAGVNYNKRAKKFHAQYVSGAETSLVRFQGARRRRRARAGESEGRRRGDATPLDRVDDCRYRDAASKKQSAGYFSTQEEAAHAHNAAWRFCGRVAATPRPRRGNSAEAIQHAPRRGNSVGTTRPSRSTASSPNEKSTRSTRRASSSRSPWGRSR